MQICLKVFSTIFTKTLLICSILLYNSIVYNNFLGIYVGKGDIMVMWQFWLIVAGIFFIGEIFTVGFLIFWLGIAALLTTFISLITDNIIIQTAVFVISSGLLLFLTKPFVDKYITKNKESVATNAFSLIGKKGIVVKEMNSTPSTFGQVKVGEEIWTAISEDSNPITEGTEIEVVKIDGVKLVVKPVTVSIPTK